MTAEARTPEELETSFEDAFVTRDQNALAQLFEDGAVLAAGNGPHARGAEEITRLAASIWKDGRTYVADPRQILQARNTALVIAKRGVNFMRRGSDGGRRYAIALRVLGDLTTEEE